MKNLTNNLKKIGLTLGKAKKVRDIVENTYLDLEAMQFYDNVYYELENLTDDMNDLLDGVEMDEETIERIKVFIQYHFSYLLK